MSLQSPIPDPQSPTLSIIIVNWNVRDLLRACLRSIEQTCSDLAVEIIVVDSASVDGSQAMVTTEFPQVILVASSENLGFPKGNNWGFAKATGQYILLLNPDTEVRENALYLLVDFLKMQPNVGVVGPQLLNSDGSIQSSRRRFPTWLTGFFESTWLAPLAPQYVLKQFYMADVPDNQQADVDWITGACMLTRRDIIDQVGGMDEAYFMYSEELDWCRRIKEAGWRIVYLPQAQVVHHVGKSSEQAITARHINFNRAKLRYFRKYHGRFLAFVLRIFLLLGYVYQIVVEGVKGLLGHKRPLRKQRIQAYWQVVRSGLKPAGY